MKEVINMVVADLATILREANLVNLLNELKKRKFENHDYNFNDIKMNPKKIFWITEVSNLKIQVHH